MIRRCLVAVAIVTSLVAPLAGCGGPDDSWAGARGGTGTAAMPAPATAAVYPSTRPVAPPPPRDESCDVRRSRAQPDPRRALLDQTGDPGTRDRLEKVIKPRGQLIVGVDQDTALFGFLGPDGQLHGVDVDLARAISREIFGDDRPVDFRIVGNNEREKRLTGNGEKDIDMVIRTMTINCERKEQVAFSTVYFEAVQRVLVRKDSDAGISTRQDLGGKKVCVTQGSTSGPNLFRFGLAPPPDVVATDKWNDCLVLLQQGRVDAVSTDHTILDGIHASDPTTEIVGGADVSQEPYGVAVNLQDTDVLRAVNGALENIRRTGAWKQIYGRYLGDLGSIPDPPAAQYCTPDRPNC